MLLSVIAGSVLMLTRTELGVSRNLVLSARAEAFAEGGVHLAIRELLMPDSAVRAQADGHPWRFELEDGILDISARNEAGRIDVNAASAELLIGLLMSGGLELDAAEILADRIVDWRDPDDEPRPSGAEQADYEGSEPPVRVGNGPFFTADEILRVPGMTTDIWARIGLAVTVHSRRPGINPTFAPREALLALPGVDEETADAFIAARDEAAAARGEGTTDSVFAAAKLLPQEALRFLNNGSSKVYGVRSRARLREGTVYILEAAVEILPGGEKPWRIHQWRPGLVPVSK